MNDLMTLSKKPLLDEALFRILGSTHASSQIDYSLHYEIIYQSSTRWAGG
jgi:hypothetical protein